MLTNVKICLRFVLSRFSENIYTAAILFFMKLLEKTGANIGSICKIRIMNHAEVDPMPLEHNGQLIDEVTPAEKWQELYFTRDSAHFVEPGEGQMSPALVKFRAPKDSPDSLATILKLERSRWIVEITDLNGFVKIAGRDDEPCAIRRELRDHGQNRRDSNHYNMVISLTRSEPVPFAGE
jgi:hypothetical protein